MKRVFFGKITLLLASFLAIGLSYAMEEKSFNDEQILHEIDEKVTDSIIEGMYTALSQELEKKFPSMPHNFYEAVVRLKSIEQFLEQSVILPEIFGENFKIDNTHCTILLEHNLPHGVLHPIFKHWFKKTCKKILLEHPTSVEAMNLIVKQISINVAHKNKVNYRTAIKRLPLICKKYIKEKFIDAHGWPYDIKPFMSFDEKGINTFKFVHNNHLYRGAEKGYVMSNPMDEKSNKLGPTRALFFPDNPTFALSAQLRFHNAEYLPDVTYRALTTSFDNNTKEEDGIVFPQLWKTPSLEEALEKRAQENEAMQEKNEMSQSNCIIC